MPTSAIRWYQCAVVAVAVALWPALASAQGFGSADLSVTKSDSPDPVTAGSNLTYTITVTNEGPDAAASAALSDTLPAGTTFVSLSAGAGWSCTTPAVGAAGTISCTNASLGVGSVAFTLTVAVAPATAAGTVLSNTATVGASTSDPTSGNNSATATTTVTAAADLTISKTDSPDPVTAGSNLTYQITVSNSGPSNAASAALSDTLPAGTTFVSLSTTGSWSCTTPAVGGSGTVSCTNASFAATVDFFTLVVAVAPSTADGTVLSNTATVGSSTSDPNGANNSATATTTIGVGAADLAISKTDSPDPVTAGSNLTYQITVTNNGPSNAASAALSDTLPANTTFVSLSSPGGWSCTTPAVGAAGTISCTNPSLAVASAVFTLTVSVAPSTAAGTVLSNTATVGSSTSDPNGANNSATATTTVASSANLSVTKTDTPDPVTAGNNITYAITMTNAGPSHAASVVLSDTVPANTTFVSMTQLSGSACNFTMIGSTISLSCGTVPASTATDFSLVVQVAPSVANGTIVTNTATVTSDTADPNADNNSATATTTVGLPSADLSITKVDTPDPVTAGTNLAYTITVSNAGPSNATTASLSDTLPATTTFVSLASPGGWSCTTPAVGAGGTISCTNPSLAVASAVFTLTVAVAPSTAAGTVLSNTATVDSATIDPNPGDGSATATTTIGAGAADLSITKGDTSDPVTAGTNLAYTLTVINAGPSDAASASLSDTLPANTTFVSLTSPAGWSCTTPAVGVGGAISCANPTFGASSSASFTLTVKVSPSTAQGTTLTNTATIGASTTDGTPGNNAATATTTVAASADLAIGVVDAPDPVTAGTNLAYAITVTSSGPSLASSVSLSDTLPADTTFVSLASPAGWSCTTPAAGAGGTISCSLDSFDVGSAMFTLTVAVAPSKAAGTVLINTATVSASTADGTPGNNSSSASTSVGASADLSIGTVDTPDPVTAGGNLTYTITVMNNGPSAAASVTVTDAVPANTTFVAASVTTGSGWTTGAPSVGSTGTVIFSKPTVASAETAVFQIVVRVGPATAGGTNIANSATIAAATTDPTPSNNSGTASTRVNSAPTISTIASQTIATNTTAGPLPFTIDDVETAAASLLVSASSTNPALVPDSNIAVAGSGANRSITIMPLPDQSGQTTITVSVSDGSTSTLMSFQLTVVAASPPPPEPPGPNQAPTLGGVIDSTMEESKTLALTLTVGDDATPAADLVVTATSSMSTLLPASGVVLTGAGATRTLTLTPLAEQIGHTTLTVSVSDGALTTTRSAVLTVVAAPPPLPPTNLIGSALDTDVTLTWIEPASGATPTFYVLEGGTAPGLTTLPVIVTPTRVAQWTVKLPAGVYFFRVRAANRAGTSAPSNEAQVIVTSAVPLAGAPTGLAAIVEGLQVTLGWQPSASGGPPTSWQLELGSTADATDRGVFAVPSDVTRVTGELAAGEYFARVRGLNAAGPGQASNEARFRLGEIPACDAPRPPVLLPATVNGRSVTLAWRAPGNEAVGTYRLLIGSVPGASDLATLDLGPVTSFVVTAPPGAYHVTVIATNACGSSEPSNPIVVRVGVLDPPANLAASVSGNQVAVSWSPVSGAASYVLEAGYAPGLSNAAAVPLTAPGLALTGVPGGTYYVRVRAVSGTGATSSPSAEIVVIVP